MAEYEVDVKVSVNGVEYGEDTIVSMSIKKQLYDQSKIVGNAIAGEIELELRNVDAMIELGSEIIPYARSSGDTEATWYPKGKYYADTVGRSDEIVSITGYDALTRLDQEYNTAFKMSIIGSGDDYYTLEGDAYFDEYGLYHSADIISGAFEVSIGAVLDDICSVIKVEHYYSYPYDYTYCDNSHFFWNKSILFSDVGSIRDVLEDIAAVCCGNFTIDDYGKLRFIQMKLFENTFYLIDEYGRRITFGSGTRILIRE